MYLPSDDTFLIADCIKQYHGQWALEKNFINVVGSDISLHALEHCKSRTTTMLVCCDAASAFAGSFDLIVSNPPYLPDENNNTDNYDHHCNKIKDLTVHGGPAGIETTIHFIDSALPLLAQDGKMLFVVSSLANIADLYSLLATETKRMHKKVLKEKRLFYETLSVIELSISQ